MAKRKHKFKGSRKRDAGDGGGVALAAVGNVVGNMLGQLLADGVGSFTARKATATGADDVAARLLKVLSERGPQSIPDLIEATGAGLTPVLHALQTVRDFRLVELVGGDADLVTLTATGNKTVTVVQKENIRRQASRLLGE